MDTYNAAMKRAKESAKDLVEDAVSFTKAKDLNTYNGWAEYIEALESLDVSEMAHQDSDGWDTVIYHYKAMRLCLEAPSSVLHEAESMSEDFGGDQVGLFELASRIAYFIVYQALADALQAEIDGCLELAQSLQENCPE